MNNEVCYALLSHRILHNRHALLFTRLNPK